MSQRLKQYVVDAFTDHVFYGNPAAICMTDEWLPENCKISPRRQITDKLKRLPCLTLTL